MTDIINHSLIDNNNNIIICKDNLVNNNIASTNMCDSPIDNTSVECHKDNNHNNISNKYLENQSINSIISLYIGNDKIVKKSIDHTEIESICKLNEYYNELDIINIWNDISNVNMPAKDLCSDRNIQHLLKETGFIPYSIRSKVWLKLSGAIEEKNLHAPNYYNDLIYKYSKHGCPFEDEINKDILRTLPNLNMYTEINNKNCVKLKNILCAYSLRNCCIGYCQGMNIIAGLLLTVLNEEDTFWIFCKLIEARGSYYNYSMCGLRTDQMVLNSLIQFYIFNIAAQFNKFNISVESFTLPWFICLFINNPLNLYNSYIFLDWLFIFGDELLFQFSLSLLKNQENQILKCTENEELLDLLLHSKIENSVNIIEILKSISIGNLTDQIQLLREYHSSQVICKAKNLNLATARRLAKQYKFSSEDEIQKLWTCFLDTESWNILLYSSLTTLIQFTRAFINAIYSRQDEINKFINNGLLSGVMLRLFQCINCTENTNYGISFNEFLQTVQCFINGSYESRLQLCFKWYDLDNSNTISSNELKVGFKRLHFMFDGIDTQLDEYALELYVQMLLKRVKTPVKVNSIQETFNNEDELNFTEFGSLINIHPFSQMFFRLPEI